VIINIYQSINQSINHHHHQSIIIIIIIIIIEKMNRLLLLVILSSIVCISLGYKPILSSFRFNGLAKKYDNRQGRLFMSEEKKFDIVPMNDDTIKQAGAFTTGIISFFLVGPVGAILMAALANYAAKKDNDVGTAIKGIGKSVIESTNYLKKLNSKYDITTKTAASITNAVSSIDSESEALKTVKETVGTVVETITKLDKDYDLVSKGSIVVDTAAKFSDLALEKVEELNAKYDFVETSKKLVNTAVEKVKEQTN